MKRGLQVGFGELIDPAVLEYLRPQLGARARVDLVRIDCQTNHDPQLIEQVLGYGLDPLVIIGQPRQLLTLPAAVRYVELRNEPDIFGPSAQAYDVLVRQCIDILRTREGPHLFVGVVSNLQSRGYAYLRALPWREYPGWIGCSFHRYPHGNRGFAVSANKTWLFGRRWTRDEEIAELRRIVGDRAIGCSEVGYNSIDYTEAQQAENFSLERQFAVRHALEFLVAYQVNDGPPNTGNHENEYGFRRLDGTWKPVATSWFHERVDHPIEEPLMSDDQELTAATEALEAFYRDTLKRPARPTSVDALGYGRWLGDYHDARREGRSSAQAIATMLDNVRRVVGMPTEPSTPAPTPTPIVGLRPLVGYLRQGPNLTFADDVGPRVVGVCSWFPALRIYRDNRDEARRQFDRIARHWQGVRIFAHLKESRFWSGLEVLPEWHDYDTVLRSVLEELWARDLRASLTFGDLQYTPSEDHPALYRRVAGICRSVNEQVVCLSGMVNEARVNSSEREDWRYWANLSTIWQSIYPWGQHGLSDPADQEEPAALIASSRPPATVALLHGTRQNEQDAIRRAFNVRYEGTLNPPYNAPRIVTPIVQDEPTGPGTDVYQPVNDRAWLFGLYTMHVITGQMTTFFSGAALRTRAPLDSDWGFTDLPRLWRILQIPDDIGTWQLTPGHRLSAPLGARSFANDGEGPHRVDQAYSDHGCYAVVYGGRGVWRLFARAWDADYRVVSADGVIASGTVRRGETLNTDLHSGHKAVVVELRRR